MGRALQNQSNAIGAVSQVPKRAPRPSRRRQSRGHFLSLSLSLSLQFAELQVKLSSRFVREFLKIYYG